MLVKTSLDQIEGSMIVWPTPTNGLAIQCKSVTFFLAPGEADVLYRRLQERQNGIGVSKVEEPKEAKNDSETPKGKGRRRASTRKRVAGG